MTIQIGRRSILFALMLVAACCVPAAGQSGSGVAAIEGVVTDPDDRAIPDALVLILSSETGYERATFTDAHGRYFAPAMPVGSYVIDVSAKGFGHVEQYAVRLTVGATETLNFGLKVANVSETITVTAGVTRLDKDDTATSTVVGSHAVEMLPIRGRDFTEFVQLSPAITQESDRNGLVISGQRSINSNIAIDGTDFNDALQGNQRGGNEGVFFFPQAAVREFQVVRSGATAEVGRTNSGFVNVVTKSGSNELHGEGFYYDRERSLTSPDAFDRSLNNQQSQMGGSFGGPLVHDRAFLFGAAEHSLLKIPYFVQFDAQASGVIVPVNLLAQQGEQRSTNDPTAAFVRTDAVAGSGLFNAQGTYTRLRGENFNFDSLQLTQAVSTKFMRKSDSVGVKVGLTTVFGLGLLNDLRGQIATDDRNEMPNSRTALITITGFGNLGGDSGRPRNYETTRYEVTDQLTTTAGAHRLRFGLDYNLNDVRQQREDNIQGRYDFKSLSDYIAGKISRYRQTVLVFDPADALFQGRQREIAAYAQDKISVGANFTASAGLRWEGQWNPQPPRPNPAIPYTAYIPNDLRQWQPRAGMAWDMNGSGRTVIRASGGIYVARTPATLFQRVFTDNGITTVAVDSKFDPVVLNALTFPNALSAVPAGVKVAAPRVFGFDPSFKNPRSRRRHGHGFGQLRAQRHEEPAAAARPESVSAVQQQRRHADLLRRPAGSHDRHPLGQRIDRALALRRARHVVHPAHDDALPDAGELCLRPQHGRRLQRAPVPSRDRDESVRSRRRVVVREERRAAQCERQRAGGAAGRLHGGRDPVRADGNALYADHRLRHPERRQRRERPRHHRRPCRRPQFVPAAGVFRSRRAPDEGVPVRNGTRIRADRRGLQRHAGEEPELRSRRRRPEGNGSAARRHRGTAAVRAVDGAIRRPASGAARNAHGLLVSSDFRSSVSLRLMEAS